MLACDVDQTLEVRLAETIDRRERIEPREEQRLGLQHVADAGGDALIEQHVADRLALVPAHPLQHFAAVARRVEQVGPERAQFFVARELTRRQQLRDRHVETNGDGISGRDEHAHVARRSLPARAGRIQMPAAVHAHVGMENEIARKIHEQMLAARGHRLDRAADDRLIVRDARERGERRLETRHDLAGKRAMQRASGTKNRIPFRHRD